MAWPAFEQAAENPQNSALRKEGSAPLELRFFGVPESRVYGRPLPPLHSRKGWWTLALLALRQGRPVDRSWLAGTLWPESSESLALGNLRRTLNDLRRALGDQSYRLHSPSSRLLSLDLGGATVDFLAFDRAIERGDEESLKRAVALHRGPLLEGCADEWVLPERETREQAALRALEDLAAAALERGDPRGAQDYLRRVIAAHPLRQSAVRSLMQSHVQQGDYAACTQLYRDLRLLLYREVNAEPDAETTALFRSLRAEARERARALPPRLPAAAPAPRRLPVPTTPFIGRAAERAELLGMLRPLAQSVKGIAQGAGVSDPLPHALCTLPAAYRLITLTGTGGVGKTRLAIAVAEEVAEEYRDGVVFVELAPLQDPTRVIQATASALEVHEEPDRPLLDTLLARLQAWSLLLILDNCEHLTPACASLAETLLARCPQLQLLATSRRPLGSAEERTWRVPSLSLPPDAENPQDYEAVRLFADRAASARPAFRVTDGNAGSVAEICRLLDGIPLALELAAAWVRVIPVAQITARLRERLDLLQSGHPGVPPRHRTLRAALDWSYDLLGESEQRLLRRLSVFEGGCSLEGAEAVCGDDVLLPLAALVDASLVDYAEESGAGRYRLLETTRQYAREKLRGDGDEGEARTRHTDWCVHVAEEAARERDGGRQSAWHARLTREDDNLRAALEWSQVHAVEKALRMAVALHRFWRLHGRLTEGREWLSRLLESPQALPPALRARALHEAGWWAIYQGDLEAAQALLAEGLAIARAAADQRTAASILLPLGQIACSRGEYEQAMQLLRGSAELHSTMGDIPESVIARSEMGQVAFLQDDTAQARVLYEESLAAARAAEDGLSIAHVLDKLGDLALARRDYAAARAFYAEKLAIYRQLGDTQGIVYSLNDLGNVSHAQGDYSSAGSHYEQALALARQIASGILVTLCLIRLAEIALVQQDYGRARAFSIECLTLGQQSGDRPRLAPALRIHARLAFGEGQSEAAARFLGAAQRLQEKMGGVLRPEERPTYERFVADLRECLGEETFASAWTDGAAMTLEEAVEYALQPRL